MLSKEEYFGYYKDHGKCVDSARPKHPFNEKQLERKYQHYVDSEERKEKKRKNSLNKDEKWKEVKSTLPKYCEFYSALEETGRADLVSALRKNAGHLLRQLDGAHVFSRSRYPHMKYDPLNVVSLNRWSHSCLDQYRDPIDGKSIDKETHDAWWEFILGEDRYEELKRRSKDTNFYNNKEN